MPKNQSSLEETLHEVLSRNIILSADWNPIKDDKTFIIEYASSSYLFLLYDCEQIVLVDCWYTNRIEFALCCDEHNDYFRHILLSAKDSY